MAEKISRRDVIKRSVRAGLVVAVASVSATPLILSLGGCASSTEDARKNSLLQSIEKAKDLSSLPNFIIILTDDMGYSDLSCQGSRAIRTHGRNHSKARDEKHSGVQRKYVSDVQGDRPTLSSRAVV